MSRRKAAFIGKTNPNCICAGLGALSCHALDEIHWGCLDGTCPFFKTAKEQEAEEKWCRARLKALHPSIQYKTRDQVMDEIEVGQSIYKENKRNKGTVILAVTSEETAEYKSLPEASKETGIHQEVIKFALKSGEPVHGIKFTRR